MVSDHKELLTLYIKNEYTMTSFHSGFIALIGPPNAGKSTFLNKVLGEKIAIVSPKPQTTRTSITGIYTTRESQIVFLDTPGIHTARTKLNRLLVDAAWRSLGDAHGVVLFLDAAKYAQNIQALERDLRPMAARLEKSGLPMVVALNKTDAVKPKMLLLELLDICAQRWPGMDLVPISARTGDGLEQLLGSLQSFLPVTEILYPEDQLSTLPIRFMASEIIREKLFLALQQELPYNIAVDIEEWEENIEQGLVVISAVIYTSKKSHKGIIIGQQGQTLKLVGQRARQELKTLLESKVHLNLWVKVREGWTEDRHFLSTLGLG